MMDFVFFVKTVCLTLILVLLLQFQVGSKTLENHAMTLFHGSMISKPLQQVAEGGAKMVRTAVKAVHEKINSQFGKKDPENRKSSGFRFSWDSQNHN